MATKKAPKKVYVFFNCDETKSRASMNIFYNNEVFKDTIASKKKAVGKNQQRAGSGSHPD